MEWVEMVHLETEHRHKFPASVRESAEARGWVEADAEAESIGASEEDLAVDDGYYEED